MSRFADPEHMMQLEQTFESGAEEWHCSVCSRRIIIQWIPYKRIVLAPGDENARHTGSKGGVSMGTTRAEDKPKPTRLGRAWLDAIERLDFDDE